MIIDLNKILLLLAAVGTISASEGFEKRVKRVGTPVSIPEPARVQAGDAEESIKTTPPVYFLCDPVRQICGNGGLVTYRCLTTCNSWHGCEPNIGEGTAYCGGD
ncbi:hypothetical protein J3E72DRAFT_375198 [Bipolaris maydis]|nr:hypothetical protein J3E74DRAFT_407068 [Bipolaris maydis]KAJ6197728.1 hypothetical protein J3E72DRAFT_375198 [Bipolaris maydis]